jgi:hypothetical protein
MAEMRAVDPKLLKAMKYEEMRVQFRVSRDVFLLRRGPSAPYSYAGAVPDGWWLS